MDNKGKWGIERVWSSLTFLHVIEEYFVDLQNNEIANCLEMHKIMAWSVAMRGSMGAKRCGVYKGNDGDALPHQQKHIGQ